MISSKPELVRYLQLNLFGVALIGRQRPSQDALAFYRTGFSKPHSFILQLNPTALGSAG